ncbi:DNA polymerase V [Erwinia rhapontici]|uniref:DNA polymerase V n=1 Tax=Erwinia rhapontici TaxID=55212 RepID=UPI0014385E56|nr:DNA polymerase V [Erwinia rhapontici]NKG32132.1 DNA polymerase V [Erwinia rhapontici]
MTYRRRFRASIKIESSGRRTVATADFIVALERVNYEWTLKEANQWIEHYQSTFRDVSTEEGERRTFQLFNPNNGGY